MPPVHHGHPMSMLLLSMFILGHPMLHMFTLALYAQAVNLGAQIVNPGMMNVPQGP